MIWVGQSSSSLLKQGRYVTLGGRGDAWGIIPICWNINFDPLTLDRKIYLDRSLQVRFLNLGILTMTNRTRPLLALNILFPKQVPCLFCASNHLFQASQLVLTFIVINNHHKKYLQQISCTLSTFGSGGADKETTALCLLPLNVMQVGRGHGY